MTSPREESIPPPFFGEPPSRKPMRVTDVPAVRGKRVILSRPDGFVYDMRASSEVYRGRDGRSYVRVVSEEEWFRWMFVGDEPHFEDYPAYLVWAE
jgi:hypothetical protein